MNILGKHGITCTLLSAVREQTTQSSTGTERAGAWLRGLVVGQIGPESETCPQPHPQDLWLCEVVAKRGADMIKVTDLKLGW